MKNTPNPLEELFQLQKELNKEYEAERKALLEIIDSKEEQIQMLEELVENQNKLIAEMKKHR